jgi:hypothetical protein
MKDLERMASVAAEAVSEADGDVTVIVVVTDGTGRFVMESRGPLSADADDILRTVADSPDDVEGLN